MDWNAIARQARNVDVDRLAEAAKRAMNDKQTRDAVAKTLGHGRSMYSQLVGSGTKEGLSKLARDAKVQNEVGALVRSMTAAIDTGVAKAKRRSKRRLLGLLALIGFGAVAAPKIRERLRPPATSEGDRTIHVSADNHVPTGDVHSQAHA